MRDLEGCVVAITGASAGIGASRRDALGALASEIEIVVRSAAQP